MGDSLTHYHEITSYERNAISGGYLEWSNQPSVYKRYPKAPRLRLPMEVDFPAMGMVELFSALQVSKSSGPMDLQKLSGIFRLTCAITARSSSPGGDFFYRSTPSAGALYPCEIYLAASGVQGLPTALYHYSLEEHSLVTLRCLEPWGPADTCVLTFFLSAIFFRSSWKYRDRAYRYLLLDTGHVLENLLLALKATGTPYRILLDFPDEKVNSFLGLQAKQEVCLAVVEAGAWGAGASSFTEVLCDRPCPTPQPEPPAPRETIYPSILQAHEAACGPTPCGQGAFFRMLEELGLQLGSSYPLEKPEARPHDMGYVESLWRRRSKRAYIARPMDRRSFCCLLQSLDLQESFSCQKSDQLLAVGFLAKDVEGLPRGFYVVDKQGGALREASRGDFSKRMASACLDQGWMARAALQVVFLSNLKILESRMGARAYRHAMIFSGRMGQRIYLVSTALGLGACGVGAFYDKEAASVLGLNPSSKLLYLVTSGPVREAPSAF